ncbi:MAG: hypothetical protein HY691_05180, partial [Chloroflexi bacterium]|nr:hypothetical protein [Chloroflexota bacterium]
MAERLRRKAGALGLLLLGAAMVFLGGAVVTMVSAHGGDLALIHACVNNSSGEIKIVPANQTCNRNET